MNTIQRTVFGSGRRGGHALIPEVLETGWGRFATADSGHLRPHSHEGAFELCYIVSGEVEWLTKGSAYILRAGDVFITQPNEIHWGRDASMHPCELYWVIVGSVDCGVEWPSFGAALSDSLDKQLRGFCTHRLRGTPRTHETFAAIFEEHRRDAADREAFMLRQGAARAALQTLLIELVRAQNRHTTGCDRTRKLPAHLAQVIGALRLHAHDRDAIDLACRSTGRDYECVNREFVEHFGTTISQYWLRERIRLARERLLDETVTVTDIATQLGFSSSQHFATVFRKITGLTPSQYRVSTRASALTS